MECLSNPSPPGSRVNREELQKDCRSQGWWVTPREPSSRHNRADAHMTDHDRMHGPAQVHQAKKVFAVGACWERANQFSNGAPLGASTLQGRPAQENYQYKMDPMLCVCTCVYVYMFVCISMYINMDMYVPWHVCESERKTCGNQFLDREGPRDWIWVSLYLLSHFSGSLSLLKDCIFTGWMYRGKGG